MPGETPRQTRAGETSEGDRSGSTNRATTVGGRGSRRRAYAGAAVDTDEITITFPARPEYLRLARIATADAASRAGLDYEEIDDMRIAVSELCGLLADGRSPTITLALACDTRVVDRCRRGGDDRAHPAATVICRSRSSPRSSTTTRSRRLMASPASRSPNGVASPASDATMQATRGVACIVWGREGPAPTKYPRARIGKPAREPVGAAPLQCRECCSGGGSCCSSSRFSSGSCCWAGRQSR